VAAAATPAWAKKVFPELDEEQALAALWEAIFHTCRADRPDCLNRWNAHAETLEKRAHMLTQMKIHKLHFEGPGTDLEVHLSKKALFVAGRSKTPDGVAFEANIPTEECFTTPDHRHTTGRVRITRPVFVNGELIKDLQLQFTNGEITHFTASQGEKTFASYIANDPGAKRLGEVSLVGIDSPIYQSGRIFEEILFDENAACHIAVGFAYRFCIEGGAAMSEQELDAVGCNDSHVHTDFMISSEEVSVTATLYSGEIVPLIKNGKWLRV
jgi:aminopeptidase